MELKINFHQFEQLYKNGYSLDMVFLCKTIENSEEIPLENEKIKNLYSSILRKGLITEEGNLSLPGKDLLKYISMPIPNYVLKKAKLKEDDFDKWWSTYSSTDTFKYKGKTFNGTRALKTKKDDCKVKLKKILDEGEYTIDDMIKALEFEILQKKENSVKTGTNKLSYMQNSHTYLLQRTFEPFIELIKEGIEIKEIQPTGGGFDI